MGDSDFFASSFEEATALPQAYTPQAAPIFGNRKVNIWTGRFEDEVPLLEELGISFRNISQKTIMVLNPMKETDLEAAQDGDLTGPIIFCLLFGTFLLLTGKVHFGYIYGMGVVACFSMWFLLNLMSPLGISMGSTASTLGYCLLPIVFLAGLGILWPLKGIVGYVCAFISIVWCATSSSSMFVSALGMSNQTALIMYPSGLIYACFALLALF